VQAVLPVREYTEDRFVFFATKQGTVKKTPLTEFAFQLQKGKIAINLDEGDALIGVELTDGNSDVLLFASNGKTVRFDESEVRSMGRTATGVRGMKLADGASVVSLIVAAEGDILTATMRGYGKRTALDEFPKKGRGTQGVIGIQCSERNGSLVAATQVTEAHELMLISDQGTLVRTRVAEISQLSRNTQGVTLIRLPSDESLVSVVRLDAEAENGEGEEGQVEPGQAEPGMDAPSDAE
jgi:DNA gyrase subunit A